MSKQTEALKLALEALEFYDKQGIGRTPGGKAITAIREALAEQPAQQQEPIRLRRGDVLRCIETDELCTVWATSATGKTLVKWSANNFGEYTAEQIGELFWLEPAPDDLELAAEQSDNYAAFHAGYRFALAEQPAQQEPVAWMFQHEETGRTMCVDAQQVEWGFEKGNPRLKKIAPLYTSPPASKPWVGLTEEDYVLISQLCEKKLEAAEYAEHLLREKNAQPSKPLTDDEIERIYDRYGGNMMNCARAIEHAHGIKGDA